MGPVGGPTAEVVTPDRRTAAPLGETRVTSDRGSIHALDAGSLVESFHKLDVICGVVGPMDSASCALKQADIVVLDWLLRDQKPRHTLQLLRSLLTDEADRNALRLVAIYTGEAELSGIGERVATELRDAELEPEEDATKTGIPYRHGHVAIYAKSNVNLAGELKHRSVSEEELPEKLVHDFATMTAGLLPAIALTSLTAVREGEHKVLDRFRAELDPAFLTHRVCLPNPDDAEEQFVNHLAEELRGLMDDLVAKTSPAGSCAIDSWIRRERSAGIVIGERLGLEETVALATNGLEASAEKLQLSKRGAFKYLTVGFSGGARDLDEQLAWLMSYRTVHNAPLPILSLGSVVTEFLDGSSDHGCGIAGKYWICMRPRCDCVRLKGKTSFLFLPLVAPQRKLDQIVVRLDDTFERRGIEFDSAKWEHRTFEPGSGEDSVTSIGTADGGFEFVDTSGRRYRWRGELKAEFAQRIAQNFATTLARVAVDESEWLRRMART